MTLLNILSALKENEAYLDSIQGRIDLFTNSVQVAWSNILSSDIVKWIVDLGTALVKTFGNLPGVLVAVSGLVSLIAKFKMRYDPQSPLGQFLNDLKSVGLIKNAITVIKNMASATKNMASATKELDGITLKKAISSTLSDRALKKEIISTAGLSAANGVLTKEEITNTAAALSNTYAYGKLSTAQYMTLMSTMGLKTAFIGLTNVIKANPIYAIAAAVAGAAWALDKFTTTAQEAADTTKEAFDEIEKVVESTKSTIQSLESELESIQNKIDELDGKKLSFAEEEELERLKKQKEELEHSKEIQEKLLKLQEANRNKQAIATMKAYTKAASQGAKKAQETAKTWGTIVGAIAGVAGVLLAPVTGGASLGAVIAGGAAGGFLGNKAGEIVGSSIAENDGSLEDWYKTYEKALEAARANEQKALARYEKDSSNIDKLNKWQEAQQKVTEIETEMYNHLGEMQQILSGIEYGQGYDKELDEYYNFLDKLSIQNEVEGAKQNALDRIFGKNASDAIKLFKMDVEDAIALGEDFSFSDANAETLGLTETLKYLGITVEDVTNYFTQLGEEAEAAADSINFSDAISEIAQLEGAFGSLASIFEEFLKEGSVTATSLNGIDEGFKNLGDDWENFAEVMMSGTATVQDARLALQQLAEAYLDANIDDLTFENRLAYIERLEKLGVNNAKELVESYLHNSFLNSDVIDQQFAKFRQAQGDSIKQKNAVQGLVDLAAEKDIVIELADAYELLALMEEERALKSQKARAESTKKANDEKEKLYDEKPWKQSQEQAKEAFVNPSLKINPEEITGAKEIIESSDPIIEPTLEAPSDSEINDVGEQIEQKLEEMGIEVPVQINLDTDDVVTNVAEIESGFKSLSSAYNEFLNEGAASAGTLSGLANTFNIAGTEEEYQELVRVLGNSQSTITQVQNAVESLANAYLNTLMISDELSETDLSMIIDQLRRLGITNAEELVQTKIEAYKQIYDIYDIDLNNYATVEAAKAAINASEMGKIIDKTDDWVTENATKYGVDLKNFIATAAAKEAAIEKLNSQKIDFKGALSGETSPSNLKNFRNHMLGGLSAYTTSYIGQQNAEIDLTVAAIEAMEETSSIIDEFLNEFYNRNLDIDFSGFMGLGGSGSGSSSSSDSAEQLIDFIEMKLEDIENTIAKTNARIENAVDDTSDILTKNSYYDELIKAEKEKSKTYLDAVAIYNAKALALLQEVPEAYRAMAQNGDLSIQDFIGEADSKIADAILEYREWAQKADDAEVSALESLVEISALRLQAIEDIADDFDNIIGLTESRANILQASMDLIEASGERLHENYYLEQIKYSNKIMSDLVAKRNQIQQDFNDAVSSGDIKVGSDDWYTVKNLIMEIDEEIINTKKDVENFKNAINDLKWDNLDKFIAELDNVDSQLSHMYDLLSDNENLFEDVKDYGEGIGGRDWSKDGIASLGLLTQQMELAQYRSQQYAEAIKDLQKDYKKGLYSTDEYNEKLAELNESQWESIESYKAAKDAIIDLHEARIEAIKEGIEEEIDAYKELIDAKKEALDADKDAYDWEKTVKEKEKNISTLQKQIAALSTDSSASANAQRKKLQAELNAALEDLNDEYYNHSIDTQKDALDKEYESFEQNKNDEITALEEWLKDQETVIGESFKLVKDNAGIVFAEITDTAKEYGVQISDAITDPWEAGKNAVYGYQEAFNSTIANLSASADAFIAKLNGIKDAQEALANQNSNLEQTPWDKIVAEQEQTFKGISSDYNAGYAGMSQSDFDALKAAESAWWAAKAIGDTNAMTAAHKAAEDIRKEYGYTGGDDGSEYNPTGSSSKNTSSAKKTTSSYVAGQVGMSKSDYNKIEQAKKEYAAAKTQAEKDAAHAKAEDIRKKYGYSGGVDGSQYNKFAKGTTGVKSSQMAIIDELGEELVLNAGPNGRLQYLSKGTGVVPADLTERLMDLALDPTGMLEYSKPVISAPNVVTNNMSINLDIAKVVHIEHADNTSIPDITKAVQSQMDNYMKNINQSLRKFVR